MCIKVNTILFSCNRLFHSYGSSDIDLDTKPLRQAIWYYILRLYGLKKDDYEYRDINTFLNKRIKVFLKKVCQKVPIKNGQVNQKTMLNSLFSPPFFAFKIFK